MTKSRWTEREFWATLVPFILGILTTTGVIGTDQTDFVAGVVLMVGPSMAYIVMRIIQKIKETDATAQVKIEQAKSEAKIAVAASVTPTP
jgi:uncharacterized membrane protein